MEIGLKDNYHCGSAGEYLRKSISTGTFLSFVSAYFSIYAYDALRAELNGIRGMRFLFGEPRFVRSADPGRTATKHFAIDSTGLALSNVLFQKAVARDCERWIREKVEIKSLRRSNLLHGKMYLVAGPQNGQPSLWEEDLPTQTALLGSSNFTAHGLGLSGNASNIELNLIVRAPDDFEKLTQWFDKVWSDKELVEDVKDEVLLYLQQLYQNQSPQFVYYKTLYHVFERFALESDPKQFEADNKHLIDTAIWKQLFEFQRDGVKGAINKINRLGGCILADSVGLGKTFEALAVIKYFELKNKNVLVLCPKKLRENWTAYLAHAGNYFNPLRQDRFGYTVLSHTDLSRDGGRVGDVDLANFHWDAYDLVVIDESHNFRTESRGKEGKQSRYQRLLENVIQSGAKTKVLLLSATPVNNTLKDLRAQINLIGGGDKSAFAEFGIDNMESVLGAAQKQFNKWADDRQNGAHIGTDALLGGLSSAFFTLLDEVTIARSRHHIKKYYPDVMDRIGAFPERQKPESLTPDVDTQGEFPSYDAINHQISSYRLALFKPTTYLKPEFASLYAGEEQVRNFSQEKREGFLVGMMKVNFLKRLESSVTSFALTMDRTSGRIRELIARIDEYENKRATGTAKADAAVEVNAHEFAEQTLVQEGEGADEEAEAIEDELLVGARSLKLAHLDLVAWRSDLEQDRLALSALAGSARAVTPERDAKLEALKQILREKANQPNRKALIFTAFADTAAYLYDALHAWAKSELDIETGLVVGSGANRSTFGGTNFVEVLTHFSPRSKGREKIAGMRKNREIDFLVATDCISEGQNLQDADLVINYDIHWNPVRLIQRFGRIDRLGSKNKAVRMVNFWPTQDLNQYINLKGRVEARMALVDITATGYDGLLNPHDMETLEQSTLNYRDQQLLRLKEEILDLEDMTDGVTLTEFTLDDFRTDLLHFLEENRKRLDNAPFGLYACTPVPIGAPEAVQPGVIFCLRQKDFVAARAGERINPLSPHYLVYIHDSGEVRWNFGQARYILSLFRDLCHDAPTAFEALCDAFDAETEDGRRMDRYTILLEKAVRHIEHAYKKRDLGGLAQSRSARISAVAERVGHMEDFELVTWLVLTDGTVNAASTTA